jgi:hypothetical protein
MIPNRFLWYGVGIVLILLGLSFLHSVGITPAMLDEGLETIRVETPMFQVGSP